MHEIQIANRALDQHLIRRHTETRHNPARQEGMVVLRQRTPDATGEHDDNGEDEDRTSAIEFGEWVGDEEGQPDGQDQPGSGLREGVDADVELAGDLDEAW